MNPTPATPIVLSAEDGEQLYLRPPRRTGCVTIKVDPLTTGSTAFSMGTQELPRGAQIPVHLHEVQEETLFIHSGTGTAIIDGERYPLTVGSIVYVPSGVWHGIENDGEEAMVLVWTISPPGLEGMFREIGSPPGCAAIPLSDAEFREVVQRHGMQVR